MGSFLGSGAWWPEAAVLAIGVLPWALAVGNIGFAILGFGFSGLAVLGWNRAHRRRAGTR